MCLSRCFFCQLFFYKLAHFYNDCGCFWLYSAPAPVSIPTMKITHQHLFLFFSIYRKLFLETKFGINER